MSEKAPLPGEHDHFAQVVIEWSLLGPPLRPAPHDSAVVQRIVDGLAPGSRAVVLGLTPEIVGCRWPPGSDVHAIDRSPTMMRLLWKPETAPAGTRATLADWLSLPVEDGSTDFVAGDGCYMLLGYPLEFEALTREVARILRPAGRFAIRVFTRPDQPESIDAIAAALARGDIASVHELKLRLAAALQRNIAEGARLDDVWQAWKTMPPLAASRRNTNGWMSEQIAGIERYRGIEMRYSLPTRSEMRAILSPYFTELECASGSYELADRCPTFVMARKSG